MTKKELTSNVKKCLPIGNLILFLFNKIFDFTNDFLQQALCGTRESAMHRYFIDYLD